MAFAYWVVLPNAVPFLLNFDSDLYNAQVRAKDYYSFAIVTILACGVLFELPIFILGLVRLGIVSAARLRQQPADRGRASASSSSSCSRASTSSRWGSRRSRCSCSSKARSGRRSSSRSAGPRRACCRRAADRHRRELMYPKIELHVHLEGTVRPATLLEIARRNDYALPADTVEGLARALRVPRLRALHRGLDPDDERAPDARRLPAGRRRLRGRGRGARRRLHRGHLLARRARAARRRLGRHLRRLLRRRRGGARAARRRGPADPGHRPRLSARGGRAGRSLLAEVRATAASWESGSAGSRRSTRPSRTRRCSSSRRPRARLGAARGRGRWPGFGSRRARCAAGRSHPPRHPRGRGPGARRRARASGGSSSTSRRSRTSARARSPSLAEHPLPAARRGRRALLDLDRRPGDVRHRPHARLRRGALPRRRPARRVRGGSRGRALRRGDAGTAPRARRTASTGRNCPKPS